MSSTDDLSRRDVFRLTAGAVVASQVTALGSVIAASGHTFFTDAEYALVDELTDILIPADDHSPGARAAAAANFIDAQLASSTDAGVHTTSVRVSSDASDPVPTNDSDTDEIMQFCDTAGPDGQANLFLLRA